MKEHPKRSWRISRTLIWTASAAAVVLIGLYLFKFNQSIVIKPTQELAKDIAPGGNQAFLTMADGSTIILTDEINGKLLNNGSVDIEKKDSLLRYAQTPATTDQLKFNTLNTPRGGKYQVILPDGTHVWLNAMSSIRYPESFAENERSVEVEGEAYFEVAHRVTANGKKRIPFRIKSKGQVIEVLGTHFNVSAYAEEAAIQTTLLTGSVSINAGSQTLLIKPGEMAALEKGNERLHLVKDVNLNKVIAWKNDLFQFEDDNVASIMRQLSRWYDVEVVYEGRVPVDQFNGKVPRQVNLSHVLKILSKSGIKFEIDGRRIIVKNN